MKSPDESPTNQSPVANTTGETTVEPTALSSAVTDQKPAPASDSSASTASMETPATLPAEPTATLKECAFASHGMTIDGRLQEIEAALIRIEQQQSYLPPQIRQLGTKVEGIGNAASQPAFRALILGLISLGDLIDILAEKNPLAEGAPDATHQRNYQTLSNQFRQILQDNGVAPVDSTERFDPLFHRVVGTQAADATNPSGKIIKQIRKGYTSGSRVLRYTDVILAQ